MRCYDCNCELKIKKGNIIGGVGLKYKDGDKMIDIIKCNSCYEKSKALHNFKNCEVYSRVVGYLRPVQQWNKGKNQEYFERKNYDTTKNKTIK
jgi:hypothetical protein